MPRPRKSHATRQRLLDEGVAVLTRNGYHGTGIKEVLDRVEVPKGSFYNYFGSKEDFASEVIALYSRGNLRAMADAFDSPEDDALGSLRRFFAQEIDRQESERCGCLVGNLAAELGDTSESIRAAMAAALGGMEEQFSAVLERAQQQGTVRDDLPAEVMAAVMLNAWEGALLRMKIERSAAPMRQFVTLIVDQFLSR